MPVDFPVRRADRRVVVVSPHLDDAVLSLGASIARMTRQEGPVVVLTVLGCDPDSSTPTKGWDARAGFATEGESARARRAEDAAACAVLGARPVWLPFGTVDYDRHGGEADVRCAVVDALAGADTVILPGSPLTHPDHAWLVRTLLAAELPCRQLGFYVEQPYSARASQARPAAPGWLEELLGGEVAFDAARAGARQLLAKRRAIRRYRSQLPLLALSGRGLPLDCFLLSEIRVGGEAVAWLSAGTPGAQI